jgi:hypothetical protein
MDSVSIQRGLGSDILSGEPDPFRQACDFFARMDRAAKVSDETAFQPILKGR